MLMLQIVWPDGTPTRFHGGEAVEMDLRKTLKTALLARRTMGMLTEAKIDAAVTDAFESFKAKAHPSRLET